MKNNLLFKFILFVSFLGMLWLLREPISARWSWISGRETVTTSMEQMGIWGPLALFILFVLQVFLAFIPGQALMVACGYLYGFWGGFLLSWLSLAAGGEAAFVLARRYGRSFADKWISPDVLARWDKAAEGQGIGFFTLTLVMPLIPNDAMCYVAGLGKISHRRFSIANLLGRGMSCIVTSWIGAFGTQVPSYVWVIGIVVLGFVAGWAIYKKTGKWSLKKGEIANVGGFPLMAVHATCIPEMVYDGVNGNLTDTGDAYAMSRSMIRMLHNPPLATSMGRVSLTLAEGYPNQETFN